MEKEIIEWISLLQSLTLWELKNMGSGILLDNGYLLDAEVDDCITFRLLDSNLNVVAVVSTNIEGFQRWTPKYAAQRIIKGFQNVGIRTI